jgi:hypothetical protein
VTFRLGFGDAENDLLWIDFCCSPRHFPPLLPVLAESLSAAKVPNPGPDQLAGLT